MNKKVKELLSRLGLLPHYREDTLFLTGLTIVALFIISEDLRYDFFDFFSGRGFIIVLLIPIGIYFSVYHAFSKEKKQQHHKFFMLFFVVFVNFFIGIKSGDYILTQSKGVLIIFPIINLVNSILLIILYRAGAINEDSIDEGDTNLWEVSIGTMIVLTILFINNYIYSSYWAITFSIALTYATNFNKILIYIPDLIKRNPKSSP